jgi:hypothetical protein
MFSAPRLIFGGTEGVGSHFHVLRSHTRFRRYRGRQVPFIYFAIPDPFWAVPRALGHVFMLCALGLIFDGTKGVVSHFYVLRSQTHFRRYRWRRVPFSCFMLLDPFWVVPRAPGQVFMFCALGLILRGTEGVRSYFYFLRSLTRFRR